MEKINNSKLTIITPYYNQRETIEATILSVLNQSLKEIEYIVIDDGSTDGGIDIINKYSDKLTIIRQENKGQVKTQNYGWEIANGEYIGYLSSDDTLDSKCYETLVQYLDNSDEKVALAFPQNHLIDIDSKIIKQNVSKEFNLEETILTTECFIGAGSIFKKAYFNKYGGWDNRYIIGSDRAYFIYMAQNFELKLVPNAIAYYRYHSGSTVVCIKGAEKFLEYVRFLDVLFCDITFDEKFISKSYSNAYFIVAINSFRNIEIINGFKYYIKALNYDISKLSLKTSILLIRRVTSRPIKGILRRIKIIIK